MSFDPHALSDALAALDAFSPSGVPRPLEELAPGELLPPAAFDAAADLGFDRDDAERIVRVFYAHIGSYEKLAAEEIAANEIGRGLGFAMFWAYLAAEREKRIVAQSSVTQRRPPSPQEVAEGAMDRLCAFDGSSETAEWKSTQQRVADFLYSFAIISSQRLATVARRNR